MSDTPINTIEKDIVWVRGHVLVVLLAVALIAGSIIGGIGLFESLVEKHDARVAAAQLAKEGVSTAAQQALLAQLNQEHADFLARDEEKTALIKTLVTQMSQQRAQTQKQVAADATLDAKTAAARLVQQTGAAPTQVTVSNDLVTMDLPLTRIVVSELDLFSQAKRDVENLQSQMDAQQILTSDARAERDKANEVITADRDLLIQTIKADAAACDDRVAKQAKKDFKRGVWASILSAIGGAIARSIL